MDLEARLELAKQEKAVNRAPNLRRVVIRARYFVAIGCIVTVVGAVLGIDPSAPNPVDIGIAAFGVGYAALLFLFSWQLSKAADRFDLTPIPPILTRIAVLMGILLVLVLTGLIALLASGADFSDDTNLKILAVQCLFLIFPLVMLYDIQKARREIRAATAR